MGPTQHFAFDYVHFDLQGAGWLISLTHDLPGEFALAAGPSISQIPNLLGSS